MSAAAAKRQPAPSKPDKAARAKKPPVNRIDHSERKKGYRYIDKDPELDYVCGVIVASGKSPEWIETETAKLSRKVSRHCVTGWLHGGVKRPQNYTLHSVMLALGYEHTWKQARIVA